MAVHVSDFIRENYPEYYGWFEYPADRTVVFSTADGEWGILGNFGHSALVVDGVSFECAETLFQVMKFTDPTARRDVFSRKGQHIKMTAKHYQKEGLVRDDWPQIILDALKFCLMTKYAQCEDFRKELARTGDRFIVEHNVRRKPDTYNAALSDDGRTWSGPNLMGRLLMELRDNGKLEYSLPEDVIRFGDLKENTPSASI